MKAEKKRTLANVVSIRDLMDKVYKESTTEDVTAVIGNRVWFWDDEIQPILDKIYARTYQRLDSLIRKREEEERILREALETGNIDLELLRDLGIEGEIEILEEGEEQQEEASEYKSEHYR